MKTSHDMIQSGIAILALNVAGAMTTAFNLALAFTAPDTWMGILAFIVGLLAGISTAGVNIYRFFLLRKLDKQKRLQNSPENNDI